MNLELYLFVRILLPKLAPFCIISSLIIHWAELLLLPRAWFTCWGAYLCKSFLETELV